MFAAIPLVGSIIDKVLGAVDKLIPDKDLAARLKAEAALSAMQLDYHEFEVLIQKQAEVLVAEIRGESFLQRNWRPMLMVTFTYIIAHNFVVAPLFSVPYLAIPESMWELLKLGMGGYIAGRTVEKVAPVIADAIKK